MKVSSELAQDLQPWGVSVHDVVKSNENPSTSIVPKMGWLCNWKRVRDLKPLHPYFILALFIVMVSVLAFGYPQLKCE